MSPLTAGAAVAFLSFALIPDAGVARVEPGPDTLRSPTVIEQTIDRLAPTVRFGFTCPIGDTKRAGPCKWRVKVRAEQPIAVDPTVPVRRSRMTDRFAVGPKL